MDQKRGLKAVIKSGTDVKEVRRAQVILFLDAETSYETIEELTQGTSCFDLSSKVFEGRFKRDRT